MMLLSRKKNESIVIGNDITLTVIDIRGDKVRLGICAPKNTSVQRLEFCEAVFAQVSRAPAEEDVLERFIVEAKLERGGKIRFTAEAGFSME